jgi:hypothetical protein
MCADCVDLAGATTIVGAAGMAQAQCLSFVT